MCLITVPKEVVIRAVSAEGSTESNAFDNCLVKAGFPHISLVKVTSILPREVKLTEKIPEIPFGANVPAIYDFKTSCSPGKRLAGALAIGWTDRGPTLVAEFASEDMTKEEAERGAMLRLLGMAEVRELTITRKMVFSTEHVVRKCGCVLVMAVQVA